MRTSKTIDGALHEYSYYGNMLVYETMPSPYADDALSVIEYVYDMGGSPIGMIYFNGLSFFTYYYVKNLQGDIVQLRSWENGLAAAYEYDAWGKVLSVKDVSGNEITDSNHIGLINPIRYRGYYYDNETALYYLQSRYYDATLGRFISPDATGYLGASGGFASYNLYAYCGNDPVRYFDPMGNRGMPFDTLIWPGEIHRAVQERIINQSTDKVNWSLEYSCSTGRIDLVHSLPALDSPYVYEVKPCTYKNQDKLEDAIEQLNRYIFPKSTFKGQVGMEDLKGEFLYYSKRENETIVYQVTYWKEKPGVVLYYFEIAERIQKRTQKSTSMSSSVNMEYNRGVLAVGMIGSAVVMGVLGGSFLGKVKQQAVSFY